MSAACLHLNGQLLPVDTAGISPLDAGFQYGDGAFETVLARDGRLMFRAEHYERLRTTLSYLCIAPTPADAVLDAAVAELLRANGLATGEARVKILVSRGNTSASRPTVCITAAPYSREEAGAPCRLRTFDIAHPPPFARWKSLSYGMHRAALAQVQRDGYDDALFRLPDGGLLETASAALFAWDGQRWLIAPADARLDSITARHLCGILEERGYHVDHTAPRRQDLSARGAVLLCSALRLVQDVESIDDLALAGRPPLPVGLLREALLERGSHE